ncbi:unnamed protein product [Mytilus coruscus]|uniref:Uncharacterized protein n=1 Tax=Mytilus coruscus TaxID=42192 RepID=A0A6J8DK34_MYTCO|nr:unnamed protein product [Mytilus coruscus]
MKQVLYLTCLIQAVVIGENPKRLLLNDPDVATRFSQMEITIQKLTEQLSRLENNAGAGSTYVRWGRSICSGDNTELVYSGYAAGQLYLHASYTNRHGGPSNLLCMPGDPELTNISGNGTSYYMAQNIRKIYLNLMLTTKMSHVQSAEKKKDAKHINDTW